MEENTVLFLFSEGKNTNSRDSVDGSDIPNNHRLEV